MDINLKKVNTLDLKNELENRGWFVEIMWHIEDVQMNYNCTEADAQGVLQRVFSSEKVNKVIYEMISDDASSFLPLHED